MNRKQADNIINLIQKNINTKKQEVEKVYNQDALKAPDFVSKKVENEFALLGQMHKTLNSDSNVRQIIQNFLKNKKYDDNNIKEISRTYNCKIKTVKQLEDELVKLYNKNGLTSKFNRFINGLYISIRNIIDNNLIESSPKALLNLMNKNRNEIGLESIESYDEQKAILSSNAISKTAVSNNIDELDTLTKNVNSFTEKYGHSISVPSKEEGFLFVIKELYNTIYENITKNKILYTFLSKCKEDVVDTRVKFINLSSLQRVAFDESFTKVLTLLLANKVLALTVENKEQYIQISKVIRYDICNQLNNIVNIFNYSAVTYALAQFVEDGFVEICSKLGLNEEMVSKLLAKNGVEILDKQGLNLRNLALANQVEETNNQHFSAKGKYDIDYKNLKKEEYYIAVFNKYVESFNKLLGEKKFVPNVKIDLTAEDVKIQSINAEVKHLISLVESKNVVTDEQLKVFIDAHAYAAVSKLVLAKLAKQQFGIEIKDAEEQQNNQIDEILVPILEIPNHDSKNLVDAQIQTPAIKKYEPNFVIIENEKKNVVEIDATSGDTNQRIVEPENIIEVEVVEHKDVVNTDNNRVQEETKQEPKVESQKVVETTNTTKAQEDKTEKTTTSQNQPAQPKQEKVTKVVETHTKKQEPKKKYVAPVVSVKEEQKKVQEKPQEKVVESKTEIKQSIVADSNVENKIEKPVKTTSNPQTVVKENKMDEDNKKLNAELEKQKQEIEMLKKQLAQAQQQTNKQVSTNSNDKKTDALRDKIEAILNDTFKQSIKNLANLDFAVSSSELNKTILHTDKVSSNAQKLFSSLNAYSNLSKSKNAEVRKMTFVANNTETTVKNIMKLDYYLNKLIKKFAEKLSDKVRNLSGKNIPDEMLISYALEDYCQKYVEEMEINKQNEIAKVQAEFGDDEFEVDSRIDLINEKYNGKNGIFANIQKNYLSLVVKDIIISQINAIDYAEENGIPYVFSKDKIESITSEIVGNYNNEETHTF